MIPKEKVLEQLRNARFSHKRWMNYAKAIYLGLPVDKEAAPLYDTDCSFGKWLYGEGQALNEMPSFNRIEELHAALHDVYMNFYKTWKEPVKTGLFSNKNKRQKQMEELMKKLGEISDLLVEQLRDFEEEIKNSSRQSF